LDPCADKIFHLNKIFQEWTLDAGWI